MSLAYALSRPNAVAAALNFSGFLAASVALDETGAAPPQTPLFWGHGVADPAIPITLAQQVMKDLIEHGEVRRAVIGVGINEVTPEDAAVAGLREIAGVKIGGYSSDESPALKAGIEPGDIITRADGKPVDRVSALQRVIRAKKPGGRVTTYVGIFTNHTETSPTEGAVMDALTFIGKRVKGKG